MYTLNCVLVHVARDLHHHVNVTYEHYKFTGIHHKYMLTLISLQPAYMLQELYTCTTRKLHRTTHGGHVYKVPKMSGTHVYLTVDPL